MITKYTTYIKEGISDSFERLIKASYHNCRIHLYKEKDKYFFKVDVADANRYSSDIQLELKNYIDNYILNVCKITIENNEISKEAYYYLCTVIYNDFYLEKQFNYLDNYKLNSDDINDLKIVNEIRVKDILYDIKKWLSMENISFKKIKKYIEEKYMV